MAKLTINNITSGYVSTAALNANFLAIEEAFENTLSRDGTSPNQMEIDLDLNGYRAINSGRAIVNSDLMTLGQFLEYINTDVDLTGVIPITWEFTSLGDATYNLPLASTNAIDMYIVSSNGLVISPSSYSVSPSEQTLTFASDIPIAGSNVVVRLFGKIPEVSGSGVTISNVKKSYPFTIAGAEVDFLTETTLDLNSTDAYLNGIKLIRGTDYTVSGMTLTLTEVAAVDDILEIVVTNSLVAASQDVLDAEAAASSAANSASDAAQSALDATTAGAIAGAIAGGTGIVWSVIDANYSPVHQEGLFVNSLAGVTITLPASPDIGTMISIVDYIGAFWLEPLIVTTGLVEPIMGFTEDLSINVANAAFQLVYAGGFSGWRIL